MIRPSKRNAPSASATESSETETPDPAPVGAPAVSSRAAAIGNLSDLPVAGLTRRRVAILLGALVAAWVIVLFARQVGEASHATALATAMRVSNDELAAESAALGAELALIQRGAYIGQVARGYRLGSPEEVPFVLADDAPKLAPDAPGSAAVRLGTDPTRPTPVESWARLLFGSDEDGASAPAATPGTSGS